jgi:hypothetical protein
MPVLRAYQFSWCKKAVKKAIHETVAGCVLKWGDLAHVFFVVGKEFNIKVRLEDVTVRCTGEGGA